MTTTAQEPDTEADLSDRPASVRGRGVVLTPLDVDDAELLQRWRSDPVAAHALGSWPRPLTALRERLERDIGSNGRDDFLILLPDGTPVGHTAVFNQDYGDATAELELVLAPEHRGRGLALDALNALTDLTFGELPLHRLQADTHATNDAALATLAAAGFAREGVRRSVCIHRGRRHDVAVLSLLRPEWEAQSRPKAWELPMPPETSG
ncbi:GNAT family N-acetyltransferase [Kitasatospora sp. NBC_00240]|uniref:GNAT family N-acetyltransferase n=1 Tax=Kitasatospora sp. NBC_00240 TaxID=2903567 RepID=UPI00225C15D0|nr:GNAT family protein [Kitasatospora sp. NBC_00240]MCX5208536.1 GNAT family N-acetyltransferase [Kitasatospora sp. NBC_00240]